MKRTCSWDEITNCYRKKPARYKAIQYEVGMFPLPPDTSYMMEHGSTESVLVVSTGSKVVALEPSDWIVLDLETNRTVVLKDDIFHLVFEQD
jgi:hypothetical protein